MMSLDDHHQSYCDVSEGGMNLASCQTIVEMSHSKYDKYEPHGGARRNVL